MDGGGRLAGRGREGGEGRLRGKAGNEGRGEGGRWTGEADWRVGEGKAGRGG